MGAGAVLNSYVRPFGAHPGELGADDRFLDARHHAIRGKRFKRRLARDGDQRVGLLGPAKNREYQEQKEGGEIEALPGHGWILSRTYFNDKCINVH